LQIAQALKVQGYDIDRRKIELGDIKVLGSYEATLNLHRDVVVNIKIEVVAE
jgi:large subunit ribosomal protein L9